MPNSCNITDHLGNAFSSIEAMLDVWDISIAVYTRRLSENWSLEHILTTSPPSRSSRLDLEPGTSIGMFKFQSYDEDRHDYVIQCSRCQHILYAERILLTDELQCKQCLNGFTAFDGKFYASQSAFARTRGIDPRSLAQRTRKGISLKEACTKEFRTSSPCTDHLGHVYSGVVERARAYGKDRKTVEGRLERNWSIEDALTIPIETRPVLEYADLLDELDLELDDSRQSIRNRLNSGWSADELRGLTGRGLDIKIHKGFQPNPLLLIIPKSRKLNVVASCAYVGRDGRKWFEVLIKASNEICFMKSEDILNYRGGLSNEGPIT